MRFLVVGAGALGGYFGGRLLEAGEDLSFLLRPRRAAQIAQTGLVVRSLFGDLHIPSPPHVLANGIGAPFDVVIVGCKAYDLADTMASFAPAVGPQTAILPLLNGMRHLDELAQRFGRERVLGGLCLISAVLDPQGTVLHLNDTHGLTYGELDGSRSARVQALEAAFSKAKFEARASGEMLQEMWEKWIFIASVAGITCLMRATIGDIEQGGGAGIASGLLDECAAIAAHNGFAPRAAMIARARGMLTAAGSPITASMFKDIQRGAQIEGEHIIGDLLRRAPNDGRDAHLLRVVHAHLKAYEAGRARTAEAAA
ncbi:2-dehydropantoate 2-reductase [Variovorax sp. PBL-E5]|uniref:2-dehydropantoate 2-reductase n=1 Tax=Variovorax sp. PBL-E5 TaxID=434014 RepID=UPI00131791C7|nr:2-dehydropantoate 2-reductase [Variovorax sp. PBL-E5]VTU35372.1 2-dehydropantoate 2-reductase [Variovorax sp. PBL-E5]